MSSEYNVVLITTDQHRYDAVGYADAPLVDTPYLEEFAAESTVFTQARCTTPLCMPSRTTMMTGQYARRRNLFVNDLTLGEGEPHLAEVLREQGYARALVGKNHAFLNEYLRTWDFHELYGIHGKEMHDFTAPMTSEEAEVARWRSRDIPHFESPVHQPQPGSASADPTIMQTDYALGFLSERDRRLPFFMYLSYEAPHFPYVLPEPYFSRFDPADMPGPMEHDPLFASGPARLWLQYFGLRMDEMSADDIRRVQAAYLGMITMVDEQLGRVFAQLRAQGDLDHTLIIVTSDHGDFWGHRGLIGKTNAVYEDLLRVPMMWRMPWVTHGARSQALVENTDIFPTILDLLGLDTPEQVQGQSCAHLLADGQGAHRTHSVAESCLGMSAIPVDEMESAIAQRDALFAAEGPMWFVNRLGGMTRSLLREDGMKLIVHEADTPELYHLPTDPREQRNLADEPAYADHLTDMQQHLSGISLA